MRNTPPPPRRVRSAHESKSATVRAAAAAPSRRQQSRWQREQQQQRVLYIAVGVLVALVVAVFAGGFIYDNVVRANEVVAQIGPDKVTAAQLVSEIRPSARGMEAQAKQLGGGTNVASYVEQQKRNLPDQTLNEVIDTHLIAQEAARRNLSVPPAEIDDKARQAVADFQASSNPAPTPESSPTAEPNAAATPAAQASPSPFTTPTAVPTLDGAAYGPALQKLLETNGLTESEFRTRLEQSLLHDKVQTAIGEEQVPATQDQVHARHILMPTQTQADDVLTQLDSGGDFATLAQGFSTDATSKDKGGDLGWFGHRGQDRALEDTAFSLSPGQTSQVVQTASGFDIIQVLERDQSRSLPPNELATQRTKAFTDWLNRQRGSDDVKVTMNQSEKDWVLGQIGVRP